MEEDIVVVTLNYRLGALGFLTTHDDVIPANLGMRDQNLALRWVQENIDLFGGDPKDIVIAGQSAASCMTCYHLLSNGSEMEAVTGAIMISGTCLSPFGFGTNSSARANAFAVGRKLGLRLDESADDSSTRLLEVLQDVPAKKLLRMAGMRYSPHKGDEGQITPKWEPVFAKDFYPKEPMTDAIDEGRFHKVPILFGINSEECLSPIYLGFLPQIKRKGEKWDQEIWKMIDINVNVQDRVKAAEDMKVFYTDESFSEDPASVVKFCTDDEFTLPMGRHAESASKHGVPVYMYMVDHKYVPHFIPGVEGVGHGEDLYFFWNSTFTQTAKLLFPNFKLILRRMVRLLSNFVKYKKPIIKPDALFQNLEWPKFDSKDLLYLKIDSNLEVLSDMRDYSAKRTVYNKHIQKPISVY
ncbi:unnamed protein product [Callosobruchus maculatus]|nr:unnamed protein product [Callosobruchus maculatus]